MGFLLASISAAAFSWGPEGHRIVGQIADAHLTAKTRAAVRRITSGDSLADIANWMDEVRGSTPEGNSMRTWHYDNIDVCNPTAPPPCADGGCATRQIQLSADALRTGGNSADMLTALRVLTHLIGDIHQPLHASDNADRGGNSVLVENRECFDFNTRQVGACRLHAYWDSNLVKAAMKGFGEKGLAKSLATAKVVSGGDARTWAIEANDLAKAVAYDFQGFSCGGGKATIALPQHYDAKAIRAVREQLARAGQRLAGVLNEIFDREATETIDLYRDARPALRQGEIHELIESQRR